MNRIILADDQPIFRAGAARVLALEDDMRIVAQCEDLPRLLGAIESFRVSVVIFSSGLQTSSEMLLQKLKEAHSLAILITEKKEPISQEVSAELGGVIGRSTTSAELIDTVRRVARPRAVVRLGAQPVFIDCRPDTLNMDETLIERAITPRTRAIFVVHYAGVSCEMDRILTIARQHGLRVIEDAAQGVNAYYNGKALGSLGDHVVLKLPVV